MHELEELRDGLNYAKQELELAIAICNANETKNNAKETAVMVSIQE